MRSNSLNQSTLPRTIIIVSGRDGGPLTLTATQPRARQLFEMVSIRHNLVKFRDGSHLVAHEC